MECILPKKTKEEVEVVALALAGDPWMLHIDKASNVGGSGAGIILASLDGIVTEKALCFCFKILNSEVEYQALLTGLRLAHELEI